MTKINTIFKKAAVFTFISILCFVMVGCMAGVPDEKKINEDIKEYFSNTDLTIEEMTIIKRQTNKDDKKDIVYSEIVSNDSKVRFNRKYILSYNYYDEGGWILDNVEDFETSTWTNTPISGAPDNAINAQLEENDFPIATNYDEIKIVKHNTDLKNLVDNVTIALNKKSNYLNISGTMNLKYVFDENDGVWVFKELTKNPDYKEELILNGKWVAYEVESLTSKKPFKDVFIIEISSVDESGNVSAEIISDFLDDKSQNIKATGTYDFKENKLDIKSTEKVYLAEFDRLIGRTTYNRPDIARFVGEINMSYGTLSGHYQWKNHFYGNEIFLKK